MEEKEVTQYKQFFEKAHGDLKEEIGTIGISLNGIRNQLKPILQEVDQFRSAYEQYTTKLEAEIKNLNTQLKQKDEEIAMLKGKDKVKSPEKK